MIIKSGWWQTTWFPDHWWQADYWLEYGSGTPPVTPTVSIGDKWVTPAKMAMPKRKLRAIRDFLEAELSE